MKLPNFHRPGSRRQRGFTMVEIAIAVAVIAFAMVAIVGLLPLGMETQRDNRQDTIINHDGAYLLEAIRGGATNLDDLVGFVDSATINDVPQAIQTSGDLIRVLSSVGLNSTNKAIIRTITGAASTRNPAVKDFAMRYQVVSQVIPAAVDPATAYAGNLGRHLYEVRLALYWPITPKNQVADGARRQVFRTLMSGTVDTNGVFNTALFKP
jgi:prepilin-type N-terminal cleavage/methylation domain-containing protein